MNRNEKLKDNIITATYVILLAFLLINISQVVSFLGSFIKIVKPFIIGICIAFVLNLLMKFYEEKLVSKLINKLKKMKIDISKGQRVISLILTLVTIVGIISALITFIIPQLGKSASMLVSNIPEYAEKLEDTLSKYTSNTQMMDQIYEKLISVGKELVKVVGNVTTSVVSQAFSITMGVTSTIVSFIMGIIIAIYLLMSKEKFILHIKKVLYAYLNEDKVSRVLSIARLANDKFSRFIVGQCIEACILGLLCFIAMNIARLPYSLLVSTLVGITALIPIFGAFIGAIPSVFIIFMVEPIKALWFIVVLLIIQQIEGKLIYPFVVGSSIGLSAIWILFAITVGGSLMGVTGMLIGVPLFGVAYTLFAAATNRKLKEKNIDITSEENKG